MLRAPEGRRDARRLVLARVAPETPTADPRGLAVHAPEHVRQVAEHAARGLRYVLGAAWEDGYRVAVDRLAVPRPADLPPVVRRRWLAGFRAGRAQLRAFLQVHGEALAPLGRGDDRRLRELVSWCRRRAAKSVRVQAARE